MKKSDYLRFLRPLQIELVKFQRWVADSGERVLAVFEGRDSAGKGGAIKCITEHLNPRICRVVALPRATDSERTQWYFQRYISHLPSGGEIVLFDRSWYNRAGVERVMGFCSPAETSQFLESAPILEKMLVRNGMALLKFYFSIRKEEQAKRLARRKSNPLKQWQLSPLDLSAQEKWDEYTRAEEGMFRKTSTREAPWIWVDANDGPLSRIHVIRRLLRDFDYPGKKPALLKVGKKIIRPVPPGRSGP